MYYVGFTYWECYNIPIWQRIWFIDRLQEEIKRYTDKDGNTQPTRAAHQNTQQMRELMGRQRNQVPANLRRFT
jgi:hypothetical protein